MIDHTSALKQLELFNQNPVKKLSFAEQVVKPVLSEGPTTAQESERPTRIIYRIDLMPDGSQKHYDSQGRLVAHTHIPEPEKPTYLADNARTTSRAKSSKSLGSSHTMISALEQTSHQIHEICQHWARMQGKQWLRMEDHLDYLHKMARVVGKRELAAEYLFLQGIAKHHRLTQTGDKNHD